MLMATLWEHSLLKMKGFNIMSETVEKINEYLQAKNCTFKAHFVRKVEKSKTNDWGHFAWVCEFTRIGKPDTVQFNYKMGLGHIVRSKRPEYIPDKPKAPSAADLLYSVLLDASYSAITFEDFCNNLGYDTDSRKALETYLLCQENGKKLGEIFTNAEEAELNSLLEDF